MWPALSPAPFLLLLLRGGCQGWEPRWEVTVASRLQQPPQTLYVLLEWQAPGAALLIQTSGHLLAWSVMAS